MTRAEAIEYLRPIMESASLPRYQQALRTALADMALAREVETAVRRRQEERGGTSRG